MTISRTGLDLGIVTRKLAVRLRIGRDVFAFAVVGLAGMCIDTTIFNVLRLGLLGPSFSLAAKPLTATVISASVAMVFNWMASRQWAFRAQRRPDVLVEFAEYIAVAVLGLGVGLLTLAFTHYSLGFTSLAADNFSKNVLGLGLGTVTRFLLLRFWVWGRHRSTLAVPSARAESDDRLPTELPSSRAA